MFFNCSRSSTLEEGKCDSEKVWRLHRDLYFAESNHLPLHCCLKATVFLEFVFSYLSLKEQRASKCKRKDKNIHEKGQSIYILQKVYIVIAYKTIDQNKLQPKLNVDIECVRVHIIKIPSELII